MVFRCVSVVPIVAMVAVLGSCHRESRPNPLAPPSPGGQQGLAGRWEGEVADRVHGRGGATVNVTAMPLNVIGTWTIDFTDAGFRQTGTMNGGAIGSTVSWLLTPVTPITCDRRTLSGTLAISGVLEGDRITGSYFRFTCDATEGGTVELRKVE